MGHERAGRNDRIHNSAIDQLRDDQALLCYGHRASQGHHHETIFVPGHRFENIGSFTELAAGESGLGHGADEVVYRVNFSRIEGLQWDQAVLYGVVKLTIDPRAFVMIAVLRAIYLFQEFTP